MATIDLSTITDAVSEEQPCGPDLDMEFDMDFMSFSAEIDGVIPTRYFDWDPSSLDFKKYYDQIAGFLERTRDIRLLVPLAKLRILQSDLAGFADTVVAIHRLLRERWSDCHPQPGEFLDLGMGQLSTLDDMPNVVLPLQHAKLAQSRRSGPLTLRRWQVAHGEVKPREGEDALDPAALATGLAEADAAELAAMREILVRARDAVAGIRTICIEEAGFDKAPVIERLPQALEAAIEMLGGSAEAGAEGGDGEAAADAEGAAAEGGAETVVVRLPAGAMANRGEAVAAMRAAERYFALQEPSSPVPMLLREAQAASGKNFFELVNELMPENAAGAVIALGRSFSFDIPLATLDARNPAPDYDAGIGNPAGGMDIAADSAGDVGAAEAASPDAEEASAEGEPAGQPPEATPETPPVTPAPRPAAPHFVAASRPEAVALLEKVLAYYRGAEPTSPVPLLVERAINLSSKNFIELLGQVMPEGALKAGEE